MKSNRVRPIFLASKVFIGHLGAIKNSSESAIGYLGYGDGSRLGWLGSVRNQKIGFFSGFYLGLICRVLAVPLLFLAGERRPPAI